MPRPYTIRYGPWVPDLQDVGVEMPMQWTDTEIAVADCQNVYWQDGSYRCMPNLVSFGPSLGTPALDCFTWYDNTQQKEVLFAATANGFFTLIDGTWTEISTQVNETALGLSISIHLGSPVGLSTAMSPTSGSASGGATSYTFGAFSAVIGYGSASSYNWRFGGASGPGSWVIASGQGTASAAPEITGAVSGSTSSATLYCDITFSGTVYTVSAPVSYACSFSPTNHSYTSGSGTETVPSGATNVVIEIWGGGGGGGGGDGNTGDAPGSGGGGAGYSRSSYACSGGQTLAYSVGAAGTNGGLNGSGTNGGASTVSSGTLGVTTMTANGGTGGQANGGTTGTGGTASGGNQANASGTNAVSSTAGTTSAGINANNPVTDGKGGNGNHNNGLAGATGLINFYYS